MTLNRERKFSKLWVSDLVISYFLLNSEMILEIRNELKFKQIFTLSKRGFASFSLSC